MKKIISIVMVMVIGCACVGCSGTKAAEDMNPGIARHEHIEDMNPGIVGLEHIEKVIELDEMLENNEIEKEYDIEMAQVGGYWMALITGADGDADGWVNVGFYDHYPTEEEINVLWAKRMLEDDMYDEMSKYY